MKIEEMKNGLIKDLEGETIKFAVITKELSGLQDELFLVLSNGKYLKINTTKMQG